MTADAAVPVRPEPGPTDSLLDVPGIRVGQVELGASPSTPAGATGVTAIVVPRGAVGGVDVRGGAPGTRETDALAAVASGERVHAILLVGRSVFGLAAADGATSELEARGIGHDIEAAFGRLTIPIVAAAVVFDFAHGDPTVRPGPDAGRQAVAAALDDPRPGRPVSGNAGAGAGAVTGGIVPPMTKGGAGHASLVAPLEAGPLIVGGLVVVNSAGSVVQPEVRRPWAEASFAAPGPLPDFDRITSARGQTTLGVVATNARLSKAQLVHVAAMAHDGLARAIRPAHGAIDGDVVFALAVPDDEGTPAVEVHRWGPAAVTTVGAMAADVLTRAIIDALRATRASGDLDAPIPPDP